MVSRRWALLALAAVAALVVILGPATGQTAPKGTAGDSRCLSCHAAEGMIHIGVGAPSTIQVPAGQVFNLTFTVVDPWKHHLEDNAFSLNLSKAPGVSFVGGEDPVVTAAQGELPLGASAEHPFTVTPNSTELHITLTMADAPLAVERQYLRVLAPSGRPWNSTDASMAPWQGGAYAVHLGVEDLVAGGTGEWTAVAIRALPQLPAALQPPGAAATAYAMSMGVYGNVTGINEIYLPGPDRLNEGDAATYTFQLKAAPDVPPGGRILWKARSYAVADVPEDHPEGHPADMQDVGLYVEWNTLGPFTVGDVLITSGGGVPTVAPSGALYGLLRSWSYALGYASVFLVVPALVLGGTFGRASVAWLNRMSLGARRRVLWHNAASWGLLVFSLLHMTFFLLEPAKTWTTGMLWGGISLACLIMLGVTGALQRRFVEKWGFATWRYMHFGIAIMMVALILLHLGLDGTNFRFIRDALAA